MNEILKKKNVANIYNKCSYQQTNTNQINIKRKQTSQRYQYKRNNSRNKKTKNTSI